MKIEDIAVGAVREACLLTRRVQSNVEAILKEDSSPVTVADFVAQAVVARALHAADSSTTLVAEEEAATLAATPTALRQVTELFDDPEVKPDQVCGWVGLGAGDGGEDFWTLDPVDGTKGFLRGDQYAIALARVRGGVPVLGILGCPNLDLGTNSKGVLFLAVRGEGVQALPLDGGPARRLAVSPCDRPSQARVLRSYEKAHTDTSGVAQFERVLGIEAPAVGIDSQAKYGMLAAGEGELYLRLPNPGRPNYREKIWDHAAGSLVVEEAGGQVTDLDGVRLDFSRGRKLERNRGVLASNGQLHRAALEAVAQL